MDYVQKSKELFLQGYNCAQSVAMALADKVSATEEDMQAIANPFGGGFCRLREVCGAVSGMLMIIGLKNKGMDKVEMYALGRKAIEDFEQACGSYICRDLIKADANDTSPVPSKRTDAYYAKRPCLELVQIATEITLKYIED
ncbi:MAG: C_GCAxxG_C_C family protein [Clostridia bacterium]|nr:C_GCAxxG_C_C family protein [Clostridia bacterium]